MSLLKLFGNSLISAFNDKICYLNETTSWSHMIDFSSPYEKGRPLKYFDGNNEKHPREDIDQQIELSGGLNIITSLEVHENKSLLAIVTSDKSLFLYKIENFDGPECLKLLSRRLVARASSCMQFSAGGRFVIVCDKSGDCYEYDCENITKPGRWILGHMSQVLAILVNSDDSLIVTSERDEKIRVTKYPQCHTIQTFCLGHTEFVSDLKFLDTQNDTMLLSLSGDETLRIWEYRTGKELLQKQLKLPGIRLATKHLDDGYTLVVILCYKPNTLAVYRITTENNLQCEFIQDLKTTEKNIYTALTLDDHNNLIAQIINADTSEASLKKYKFDREKNKFSVDNNDFSSEHILSNLNKEHFPYTDKVSSLFKKKFDNIKVYLERKRKRIDDTNKEF
ncbi:tRNA (guanine-N(7)-)-methyltransferase non-catalytic subunit wuho [Malaya genurostris]|uniref:tRNA (guanine-N(7)-)-methyltransferase non-catalytic subunit wuho n=1 Tax=Malaya genurostris TaxID=325434 RepID=UPI0026F3C844|nr:tRNA (guanine-N(7)-)-methyltransferase non-catalytic subunit wuho [Malaya genurostris]